MSDVYRKYWKAKFNRVYTASFVIEPKCARMSADSLNTIEVTTQGINIQPGPGNPVAVQTMSLKGPLTKKTPFPFTLLPGPFSFPTEIIDMELLLITPELAIVSASMGAIVAAG